jgi:ectoine hydroxylase-related dioxygenase (phytanoyl-CoA dioxygenase family)
VIPTVSLTAQQCSRFHHDGYLAIPSLTTHDDVARLRVSYDRIFSTQAGRDVGDQFDLAGTDEEGKRAALPQILHPAKYAPEMKDSLLLVNATAVAQQLLGPDATCEIAHAIFKPALTGAETPWHQDAAYWDPALRYSAISIWVPLQEATTRNGCMEFISGSHLCDVLTHRSMNNDPRIHALELAPGERYRLTGVVSCPLAEGGATFHGPYMLHHTGPNQSTVPRRALILNAAIPPVPRPVPLHFPWMEQKVTAREERARLAASRGTQVDGAPTGAF